ncbi:hypothetical protein BFP97_06150 [Roseivirga sp. 4D4]|uniref:serine hydrolase domain-containing protein n=1 Tax=Roseivirga sp. 4D4 TaxID=1889784 RepID=UPI0008534AE4|nr:serine hydrolase domain-containing protein [Roseivirga sp. 4D4]OEK01114.1 hypothetical protein BFP97_06150 [Roseivirga sp. 4D4]
MSITRKIYVVTLILITTVLGHAQSQDDYKALKALLEKEVPPLMEQKNVPGMAIAIFDKGEVVYQKGLGLANVSSKRPVTMETGFNIGSISKLYTAWGVMRLVQDGKIDLETPVEEYISRWKIPASSFDSKKVTVRALLSHTAGLSVHGYPGFSPRQKLPSLEASLNGDNGDVRADEPVEVVIEPRTKFQYSGGGYTVLQLMIEEVTGKSFAQYMERTVFRPLDLQHTSFTIDRHVLQHTATPYNEAGEKIYLERFTAKAAAGLHTTLEDMIKFTRAALKGNTVLAQETLASMRRPDPVTNGQYGLGYMTLKMGPVTVQGHAGSNDGWESGFLLDYEDQSGVIILTNGSLGKDVAIATLRKWAMWKTKASR